MKNITHTTINQKTRKLPKLSSDHNSLMNKIQNTNENKMYDTRGKKSY